MSRRMRSAVVSGIGLCLLLAPAALGKKKEKGMLLTQLPNQTAEVRDADRFFVLASRPCDNYAWAAVLESMLRAEGAVPLKQEDWVVRSSFGPRCLTDIADYAALVRNVPGDYVLDSGRKIRISAHYQSGAPTAIDAILWAFKTNKPLLLVWKRHPYFFFGVVYDEYVGPEGERLFELRELKLLDPAAKADDKKAAKVIRFVKGSNDAAEIDGMMTIAVSDRAR